VPWQTLWKGCHVQSDPDRFGRLVSQAFKDLVLHRATASTGRQKGTPTKATADVKRLARKYGPDAIEELARPAREAQSEQARTSAVKKLLDRAYGKCVQPVSGEDGGPTVLQVIRCSEVARQIVRCCPCLSPPSFGDILSVFIPYRRNKARAFVYKSLKSLARPRGIEPLFSP
jgi:hypothetical protein